MTIAITTAGSTTDIGPGTLPRLDGDIITPDHPGYDDARQLWNGMLDRHPAAIARCASEADVQAVVAAASERDLLVAVRGGGHNVAGTASADGALVIDLTDLSDVTVDAGGRRASAGGGATWADLDAATQAHGLATPGGVVSDTGIGGLTLSGGIGWLRRKHGLSCDNLVAARLVTADGDVRDVDDDSDPELAWGLRGGGGNFGVATELTYRLHEVGPEVFCAFALYHADRTSEILSTYRDYTSDLADEVSSFAICGTVPEDDAFPTDSWGEPYVLLMAVAATAPDTGRDLVQPLRELGDPIVDMSDTMPYVDVQQLLDEDYPTGMRYYWRSLHLPGLDDDVIERCRRWAAARPTPLSTLDIWHLGGAMARVDEDATAYGDRGAPYLLGIEANWQLAGDDDANMAWARDCMADFRALSTGREYLNFPGFLEDADATLRSAHGAANFQRLAALKARVDPENRFRLHQNIEPGTTG